MSEKVNISLSGASLFPSGLVEKLLREIAPELPKGRLLPSRYMPRLRPGNRTFRKAKRK